MIIRDSHYFQDIHKSGQRVVSSSSVTTLATWAMYSLNAPCLAIGSGPRNALAVMNSLTTDGLTYDIVR